MEVQTIRRVRFETMEQRIIREKGLPNIGVAFVGDEYAERRRNLNHVSEGFFELSHAQRALDTLERTIEALQHRCEAEWWKQNAFAPLERPMERTTTTGIPLIADPERFCNDMAENALAQARATAEAASLVLAAVNEMALPPVAV